MFDAMKGVVKHVFDHWTGMQLAIENCLGGPHTREALDNMVNFTTSFCLNQAKDPSDIYSLLEEIMDCEFNTICEDGSIEEISPILYKFVTIIKSDNCEAYEYEFNKLPTVSQWRASQLVSNTTDPVGAINTGNDSDNESNLYSVEDDSELEDMQNDELTVEDEENTNEELEVEILNACLTNGGGGGGGGDDDDDWIEVRYR